MGFTASMKIRFRDADYRVVRRGDAWAIEVAGGWYFVSGDNPGAPADAFLRARGNAPQRPAFLASQRYPLLLTVDGVTVRAWPALVPRERGAKTYTNPATGDRVAAVKEEPVWMFAARGRPASGNATVTAEQTIDDVRDLATIWLRSEP